MTGSQLVSLSADKVLKVWDCSNFRCLQTIYDETTYRYGCIILRTFLLHAAEWQASMHQLFMHILLSFQPGKPHYSPTVGQSGESLGYRNESASALAIAFTFRIRAAAPN